MGLRENWEETKAWLKEKPVLEQVSAPGQKSYRKKCPEVPVLKDYGGNASEKFWEIFPENDNPLKAKKTLKFKAFRCLVNKAWVDWGRRERAAAKKALRHQKKGAGTRLTKSLGRVIARNAKSAVKFGEMVTDSVAQWVKKGMVSGPFDSPPLKKFRVKPLMAVEQKDKVRPIMNLSGPKGRSFNESVDELGLDRLKMSSAKEFGDALLAAGPGAVFAKYDIAEA